MRKNLTWVILAIFVISVPGCASKYGEQRTQANYYPGCYQPIADLRSGENYVAKSTGAGALLGAFTGAVVGLLASGGKWQGAVVGGATGGVAGTMLGNAAGRSKQAKDDNARMYQYMEAMDGDISNMDIATAAARTSLQCYDRQFNALLADIRARRITRQVAEARFGEISTGREEAINILGDVAQQGQNLTAQYEQALNAEEEQMRQAAASSGKVSAQDQGKRNVQAARQKTRTVAQKATNARQDKDRAMAESSRQTREINQMYANLEDIRR